MSEYRDFLCDIYQDDELLHEKIGATVFIADGDLKEFSEKIRFKEAAQEVIEEECLEKVEREYEGGEYEFKVIVTEVLTDQKRTIFVEIAAEETIEFNCYVTKEDD